MACVFCNIVDRLEKSFIVFEDNDLLCFLDKRPLFLGHSLLIPKCHYETLTDIPSSLGQAFFTQTQLLAKAVQTGMGAQGMFIASNNGVSQSVPHFHTHLVPRNQGDGLKGFFWPRQFYSSGQQMEEVQKQIQQALKQLTD